MARRRRGRPAGADLGSLDDGERYALERHLHALGIPSIDDYVAWCADCGFSAALIKTDGNRAREVRRRDDERAAAANARHRIVRGNPSSVLDRIVAGEIAPEALPADYRAVADLLSTLGRRRASRDAFRALLDRIVRGTKLFSARQVIRDYPADIHNSMLGALASLATHRRAWIRPLEQWKPDSKNARRQFASLARHLLAEYPVPAFMDSVWFKRTRSQNWFLHVGSGGNIRTAERLLVPLNKRMAHHFLEAPDDYTVEHAFRWGQVHGLGGNARIADAVRATRLGASFRDEPFWTSVLRFFIANPMLDTAHYGPIVDYIHHRKFEPVETFVRPGVVETRPPPQPGFSMHRRDAGALLRQVEGWHRALARIDGGDRTWVSCGIEPFSFVEGSKRNETERRWRIDELRSARALADEGRAMSHCVASYASSCATGRTSIWSLRVDDGIASRRVLTIEVRPRTRVVGEARGKHNELPTPAAMSVLRRWAERERLTIPTYVSP